MSDEPFLIAHKVRNAPAFDVAIQMDCPHCHEWQDANCGECESLGYWWIIPTSGHRAYPYWNRELTDLCNDVGDSFIHAVPSMPESLPDHYPRNPTPSRSRIDIAGLLAAPAPVKIQRRF